jgi:signal transduction histidine kinase
MSAKGAPLDDRDQRWTAQVTSTDVFLGVVLALVGLVMALPSPTPLALFLDMALVPPLALRRREPILAFSVICTIVLAQWLVDAPPKAFAGPHGMTAYHLVGALALLVAFYNLAAREPRRRTLIAAAFLEVALLLATLHLAGGRSGPALFILLSGTAAAAGVSGNNTRIRRAYLTSVEARAEALEIEQEQRARLAAAGERARIAREMHDVVAHNLSVMIALADGASFAAQTDPQRATEAMHQVAATGRQAMDEMRGLLGVLRDGDQLAPAADGTVPRVTEMKPSVSESVARVNDHAPQPGLGDLESLLVQVRMTGLRATLVTEGTLGSLGPGIQLAVYRLVQEAVTNTLKHAEEATSVFVRLRLRDQFLHVDVIDDGRGSGTAVSTAGGLGLAGMRERAALYGGVIDAGPQPGLGWRVHASFDLRVRELAG